MSKPIAHDIMVEHIIGAYVSASASQHENGAAWYSDAHAICVALAAESGYSIEQVAAVFAVFSPMKSYAENVNLLTRMVASRGTMNSGTFTEHIRKAQEILAGTSDLPMVRQVSDSNTSGDKTRAFYLSIVSAGETDAVCVDRHAFCIAVNDRSQTNSVSLTPRQYKAVAAAYRDAAHRAGISGAKMQAITWVYWRNLYWAQGAFDPKNA